MTLDTGGSCTFSVTGSSSGSCNYIVGENENSPDLTVSSISGIIKDAAPNTLVDFTPATNLAANKNIVIDTTSPALSLATPASSATIDNVTSSSAIAFTSSEALESGSIIITNTGGIPDGTTVHTCTLKGSALTSGAHTINLSDTTNSCTSDVSSLVSGAVYTFVFAGSDAAGNAAEPITSEEVLFDTTVPPVSVTDITVTGEGDATTIETFGGTLQMLVNVLPVDASDSTVIWSVSPDGLASIDETGLLTASSDGEVTVRATAHDGSEIYGEITITISGQIPPTPPPPDEPTPTPEEPTPTPDITPTPESTPDPTPTPEESTPTPEVTPTPTPEITPTPTPEITPTPTATPDATPTPEVTPTPEITPTPTATRTPVITSKSSTRNPVSGSGVACVASVYPTKPIKLGAQNDPEQVKLLEQYLNAYENAKLPVDGIYSAQDRSAVILWQEKHASEILTPWGETKGTGYIFTTSLKKFKSLFLAQCQKETPNIKSDTPLAVLPIALTRDLEKGMRGEDVRSIQTTLINKSKGVARKALLKAGASGYFGNITRAAVIEFQKAQHITPALGYVGKKTRKALGL